MTSWASSVPNLSCNLSLVIRVRSRRSSMSWLSNSTLRRIIESEVFHSVRSLNRFLLLFDRSLSAVAFRNCGGNCHGRDRQRRRPRLQHQERLVFRLQNERTKTAERPQDGDSRKNKDAGRCFARSESKRGPDDDWSANEREIGRAHV